MSPLREIALVVERELVRNLRSAKGLVLAGICVLGGVGTTLVTLSAQGRIGSKFGAESVHSMREEAIAQVYGKEIGKALAGMPEVLFVLMSGTLALAALLAVFVGFDTVAGDLQHRAVRYWTVRTRRSSYFVGKYLGMFAVASTMTLLMNVVCWIVILAKSSVPVSDVVVWGFRLWLVTLPVSAAWCALVAFFSGLFRTPILALLTSAFAWLVLLVTYGIGRASDNDTITWVHPSGFDRLLLSPSPDKFGLGLLASGLFAALFLGAALLLFQQRDA
ncbi:MAG: hypothetical protein JNL79_03925 [Myxococcales bacterium]|nr:hypothetical protein [Myxococcales bacterium]